MRITGSTRVAGVVGWPVQHSLSPLIHNAWIESLGIDAVYVPFAVAPERFRAFLQGLRGGPIAGLNVTLPHKSAAMQEADECSARAREAGAANLLLLRGNGPVFADNTDGQGLIEAFGEQAPPWRADAGPVVVLGAGGAAQGAVSALLEAGAPEVRIVNRTLASAVALAHARTACRAFALSEFDRAAEGAGALVNATSTGLTGEALAIDLAGLPSTAVVMDMAYSPLLTPLLRQAQARGLRTVDGLAMLIGQARPSFEAFFGVPPPPPEVVDVRALCLAELEKRA